MTRHPVRVETLDGGKTSIKLGDLEIAGSVRRGQTRLNLGGGPGEPPTLSVDLVLGPGSTFEVGQTRIEIPEATRNVLIALGWKPPTPPSLGARLEAQGRSQGSRERPFA